MTDSISTASVEAPIPATRRSPISYNTLMVIYFILVLIPWFLSFIEGLTFRGWYQELVIMLSITGFSMMLLQFFVTGRVDAISKRIGVDNAMRVHNKFGQYLAILFFLHPLLIILPRFFIAPAFALDDLWLSFTSPETATGVYAWSLLIVWSLMAIFKDRLNMSYEAWRYSHAAGFVAIIVLATHHVVTVGRHGHYNQWFDIFWISLCSAAIAATLYIYLIRPLLIAKRPFKVIDCHKGSANDWLLTIEKDGDFDFDFDAGQFLWISTSNSAFQRNEHPFSISSTTAELPQIKFVIRELGDYTRQLGKLKPGQRVWVDGPHGALTLTGRNATGVTLIAGGCGIGPLFGLLRELKESNDARPIRLIYGNRTPDQMLFWDELQAMRDDPNFDFELIQVLEDAPEEFEGHRGFIDIKLLNETIYAPDRKNWDYYICGPAPMVAAVQKNLRQIKIPEERILFEALAF